MDLGEPFKREIRISPGEDGTFIVNVCAEIRGEMSKSFGFTSIDDLLIWMAKHGTKSRVTELKEGDVVRNGAGLGAAIGMDALSELRRTSAAKTLADRLAMSQNHGGETGGNPSTPAA